MGVVRLLDEATKGGQRARALVGDDYKVCKCLRLASDSTTIAGPPRRHHSEVSMGLRLVSGCSTIAESSGRGRVEGTYLQGHVVSLVSV